MVVGGVISGVGVGWSTCTNRPRPVARRSTRRTPARPRRRSSAAARTRRSTGGPSVVRACVSSRCRAGEQIAEVTGAALAAVKEPIRCFSGLATAESVRARVGVAMRRSSASARSTLGDRLLRRPAPGTSTTSRSRRSSTSPEATVRPSASSTRCGRRTSPSTASGSPASRTWRCSTPSRGGSGRSRTTAARGSTGSASRSAPRPSKTASSTRVRGGSSPRGRLGPVPRHPAGSQWSGSGGPPRKADPNGEVVQVASCRSGRRFGQAYVPARVVLLDNRRTPSRSSRRGSRSMRPNWMPARGPHPPGVPRRRCGCPTRRCWSSSSTSSTRRLRPRGLRRPRPRLPGEHPADGVRGIPVAVGDDEIRRIEHALRDRERTRRSAG